MTLATPDIDTFVDEMVLMSLDFPLACSVEGHAENDSGCVAEQPASYSVMCPCGHIDLQCEASVARLLSGRTPFIWDSQGCGGDFEVGLWTILPLEKK